MSESAVAQAPSQSHWYVCLGSNATELVKVDAGTCPLRSESDRNIAVPRMNAIAKSGPTTPASGCISCLGTKRQISTTRGGLGRRLARGQSGAAACAFTSSRRSEVEADRVRGRFRKPVVLTALRASRPPPPDPSPPLAALVEGGEM